MSKQIIVSQQDVIHLFNTSEIIFCQSDDCYTNFFLVDGEKYIAAKSLSKFSEQLEINSFVRVNQSYLVNVKYIRKINRRNKSIDLYQDHSVPFTIPIRKLLQLISGIIAMLVFVY